MRARSRRHGWRRRALRCVSSLCHVFALRAAVEADRLTGAGGAAAGLRRVLLAFRPPGEGPVRGVVRGRLGGRAARFDHSRVHGAHRHLDHGEPAGRAVREILAASARHGAGAADCASDRAHRAEPDREPGDLGQRVEPHPVAEPLVCGAPVLGVLPDDFAGRIANRVMQTGPAIRETLVALLTSVWYILVYGTSALILLASADPVLALPVALWFLGYLLLLRVLVPRMRDRSKEVSEGRSLLTGRIVDSYTNILTVKLFARAREEDAYVRDAIDHHTGLFYRSLRLNTLFSFCLSSLNATMVTSTGALALVLWTRGKVEVGTVAMALPLAWQIVNIAGWVALQITSIFENIGVIQEGMMTIARPIDLTDRPDAAALKVTRGEIKFENVRFGYGRESGVIDGLTLTVRPGEKIGLIGRSGAGKSTLVNLLLRFFDLEGGHILIDGQDVAAVTQESLRAQISVVTQDTSLLHRSIRDNIRYGRPQASDAEVAMAAKLAHADEFIRELEDWKQRRGYAAQVGERGVKLSGG